MMEKTILFTFFISLFAYDSPYSLDKFHQILDISKLQAPTSHYNPKYSVKYGEFKNYANKFFYLKDNKYMVFFMCGKKNRSELRLHQDFKVNTKKAFSLNVKVKIFPISAKEFTFLQIHTETKNSINKPLLRIAWRKNYHHLKNHIWAIIRKSAKINKQKYQKVDLGKISNRFFDVNIKVKNNKLFLNFDNKKYVFDVSYWKYNNYFKAGVYLQTNGCAKVYFDKINSHPID